jgi:D-alanyl-D-alanine carboxypeptidase (penicillin-binding protein 5/6)
MGSKTVGMRTTKTLELLNYGFSTYALKTVVPEKPLPPVSVTLGTQATVQPVLGEGTTLLLEKERAAELEQTITLVEEVPAPVCPGDTLGTLTVTAGEDTVAEIPLLAGEDVPRLTYWQVLLQLLLRPFC